MSLDQYLSQFEQQGASLSRPVLNEGNYSANIVDFTARAGKVVPSKGANAGKEILMVNWQMRLALDSETAREVMKQDGDVLVYADGDTLNCRGSMNFNEYGISYENNSSFWNLVGGLFASVDLAERVVDDSGAVTYKIAGNIIRDIFKGVQEEAERLAANSEVEALLIPGKLVELELKNLTELVCAEPTTRKVYVHLDRRSNYRDKAIKEHYVRQVIIPATFEADAANLETIIK